MRLNKISLVLMFAAIALGTGQERAAAQDETPPVDLEELTCREVLLIDGNEREQLFLFMHGYMSGKNGETTVNIEQENDTSQQVKNTCIDNPDQSLLSTFEQLSSEGSSQSEDTDQSEEGSQSEGSDQSESQQ
jgi:hypothetical protein